MRGWILGHWDHDLIDVSLIPYLGQPWWRSSLALPAAQGVILETLDRVPRRAPCMEPASPSAYGTAPFSLMNKENLLKYIYILM